MFKKYIRKKLENLLFELQYDSDYMSDQYIKTYKRGWNDALKTLAELLNFSLKSKS